MIRKFTEARQSSMEKVLGGKGTLRHHHIVEPDELLGLGRLCARTVLPPGASFGLHRHTAEIEIYHILRGEGLVVGENITLTDLKGTLQFMADRMFGEGRQIRFRPSYFQFTEPSVEVDVSCHICGGKGCPVCKRSGWLEIVGSGMVHPTVLANGGYDPNRYTGFAFGMGPERQFMLRHKVNDIRYFWGNDIRFLEQF